MFIVVKIEVENMVDKDIIATEMGRFNVHHIMGYHRLPSSPKHSLLYLTDGSMIKALEPVSVIEEKVQTAALYPLGN